MSQSPKSERRIFVNGARLAGVVSCVPSQKIDNNHFSSLFGDSSVNEVVKMIGVQSRRWVSAETTTVDLCRKAGERLLAGLNWSPDSIDAIIFVSQTPDYRLPASACVLQGELGFSSSCIAFDVNLGCSGYPYAVWLGMSMIQSGAAKRVLLAVGDTISKLVDPNDRATAMLFGDAGSMTALEEDDPGTRANFVLGTDGKGAKNLVVPRGASRENALLGDARLEKRNPDCLYMDGGEIFNFTLRSIPPLINDLLYQASKEVGEYDAFLFHQANLFMLRHIAKKAKLPPEIVPLNIEEYGNTSCTSIPLLLTTRLCETLLIKELQVAIFGFGVGYSWGAASLKIGPLQCVETIEL